MVFNHPLTPCFAAHEVRFCPPRSRAGSRLLVSGVPFGFDEAPVDEDEAAPSRRGGGGGGGGGKRETGSKTMASAAFARPGSHPACLFSPCPELRKSAS